MKLPIRTTLIVNGNEWDFGRCITDAALIDGVVVMTLMPQSGLSTILSGACCDGTSTCRTSPARTARR